MAFFVDGVTFFDHNLLFHIYRGNNTEAQAILANYDPSQLADYDGYTLLHWAAYYRNVAMTRYFINRGCNVDAQDNQGDTSLMYAVQNSDCKTIRALLDANPNVLLRNRNEKNILHMMFKYLLDIDVDLADIIFRMAKNQLAVNYAYALAKKLLEYQYNLPQVIPFKDVTITKHMLQYGCSINDRDQDGNTALHYAVCVSDLAHVKMLIECGIDAQAKNNENYGCLHFYNTESKDTEEKLEVLTILMDLGATFDAGPHGNCMLEGKLFQTGSQDLINTLMQRWNVNFLSEDETGMALIHMLCSNVNPGIVDILRGIQFEINGLDRNGRTVMWCAVSSANDEVLEYLLRNEADVNVIDRFGQTVLYYGLAFWPSLCEKEYSVSCLELLLKYNINVQYVGERHDTVFDIFYRLPTWTELVHAVIAHLAMMEALGTPIDEYIMNKIKLNRIFFDYLLKCRRHWRQIKFRVHGTTAFYDLLTESKQQRTVHMRNRSLLLLVELWMWYLRESCLSIDYYNKIYWGPVSDAMRCAKLIEPAGKVLARIINLNYNHCIMDEILSYLDSRDLQNICLINFREL